MVPKTAFQDSIPGVFGVALMMLLGMPASCVGCLGLSPGSPLNSNFVMSGSQFGSPLWVARN